MNFIFRPAIPPAASLAAEILEDQVSRLRSGKADAVGEEVEVGLGVDEAGDRRGRAAVTIGDGDLVAVGMGARQREEVVFAE